MEKQAKNKLVLTDRKQLVLEGVQQVGSFDEKAISLDTNLGFLQLKGEDMHITQLNLDVGSLVVEGFICSMEYLEGRSAKGKGKGVFSRLLR